MDKIFDPQTLADDLYEVGRIYAEFFAGLDDTSWDKPAKGGPSEWTLHETIAHLTAFHGAGIESIRNALRGESYTFDGFDTRYDLNAYNRKGIDSLLGLRWNPFSPNFWRSTTMLLASLLTFSRIKWD